MALAPTSAISITSREVTIPLVPMTGWSEAVASSAQVSVGIDEPRGENLAFC